MCGSKKSIRWLTSSRYRTRQVFPLQSAPKVRKIRFKCSKPKPFPTFSVLVQRDTSLNDSIGVSDRVHGWRCDVTVCAHSDFECAVAARVVARQPLAHRTIDEGECVSSRYRYT
jgi:hypothetical protein